MNLIHITCLSNNKSSGVNNVVPSYIKWQSKYAKVFWYNIGNDYIPPIETLDCYYDKKTYQNFEIELLEKPFSSPDLVVFHELFYYEYFNIAKQLSRKNIPYVIIPHGCLSKFALKKKFIKKFLGIHLIFGRILKNASAIQYLTSGEYKLSKNSWNKNYIIIPNGCDIPSVQKREFRSENLQGTFIGRKSIYFKGLDLLLEACNVVKPYLMQYNCKINIYGPHEGKSDEMLSSYILEYGLKDYVFLHNGIYEQRKEDVLLNSDFFILTSRTEGHPVALIEALSYGVPCLVTEGTNMSSEIIDYCAGWSSSTNSNSIAESFVQLFENIDKFVQYGENARILAEKYEWSNVAREALQKYGELCK